MNKNRSNTSSSNNERSDSLTGADFQLELGFTGGSPHYRLAARKASRQIAAWWFQRMREVVDRAVEWSPRPEPRPEQIWLPNTHRSIDPRLA